MGFTFGNVMSKGFAVYGRNFLPFTLLGVAAFTPVLVYYVLVTNGTVAYSSAGEIGVIVLTAVLDLIVGAAVIHSTFRTLRSQPAGIGASLRVGFQRFLPVLGTGILVGLCIGVGTMLFIIPGLIATCILWVAIASAVVEKSGVVDSMTRSADLTSGYRWPIFGIVFVIAVVTSLPGAILERMADAGTVSVDTWLWVQAPLRVIGGVLSATIAAVGYFQLRVSKDNIELNELAEVFD